MEVVRAAPDGYTLLFGSSSSLAANVALLKNMPYDPIKDLSPIAGVADSVTALVVRSGFPAQTIEEFIAYVKQRPGKINAGYKGADRQYPCGFAACQDHCGAVAMHRKISVYSILNNLFVNKAFVRETVTAGCSDRSGSARRRFR